MHVTVTKNVKAAWVYLTRVVVMFCFMFTSAFAAYAADAVNTATVTAPAGVTDNNTSNNISTDTDLISTLSDLSVTKDNGSTTVKGGASTTYVIRVSNNGPSAVSGAVFSDPAVPGLSKTAIACSSAAANQCTTAPGIGALEGGSFTLPPLAAGDFYEISVGADVTATAGSVTNTATIDMPSGVVDPTPGNNSAIDTDGVLFIQPVTESGTAVAGTPNPAAIANVASNDTVNGQPAVLGAGGNATVAVSGIWPTGISLDTATGAVSTDASVPPGTYNISYQLCDLASPTPNCATVQDTLVVTPPAVSNVSGTVFFDTNDNSLFDPGESPAGANYIVEIVDSGGTLVATAVTSADGTYALGVPPGSGYTINFKTPGGAMIGDLTGVDLPPGATVVDQNQPIDPSGVVYDALTRTPIAGAVVIMTDAAGNDLPAACLVSGQQGQTTNATGAYRFDIIPGAAAACPASPATYGIRVLNPAGYVPGVSTSIPPNGTALVVSTCPPVGGECRVSPSAAPNPPTQPGSAYFLTFVLAAGDQHVVNNHIPLDPVAATLTKQVNVSSAKRGDVLTFTIVASAVPFDPVTLVDQLPAGLSYVGGSARVNGVAVDPLVNGNELSFAGLSSASHNFKLVLKAAVNSSVRPGTLTNRASLVVPATGAVVATANASVAITADEFFDCTDVIGKVFNDKNRNGYADEGEPGLPGVRLATVNGNLITTDAHGRYHVGCADMPDGEIGSNFILKVDVRTLPTGYTLTTPNPNTVRLTAGKMVKLNFGASVGRVVALDLTDAIFAAEDGGARQVSQIVDQLVGILAKEPSKLKLTYHEGADGPKAAQQRLASVKALIAKRWSAKSGRYKLVIEAQRVGAK